MPSNGHSGEALGNFPQAFTHLALIERRFQPVGALKSRIRTEQALPRNRRSRELAGLRRFSFWIGGAALSSMTASTA